jgi:hypothetical protein
VKKDVEEAIEALIRETKYKPGRQLFQDPENGQDVRILQIETVEGTINFWCPAEDPIDEALWSIMEDDEFEIDGMEML